MRNPLRRYYGKVSHALHQRTESSIAQLSSGSSNSIKDGSHFWQRRFYDFNVWNSGKAREKLEYMHSNPVKCELVQHPEQWPWSSWSHYETGERGSIAIDLAEEREKSQNPHR